jgi:hypothetical protein
VTATAHDLNGRVIPCTVQYVLHESARCVSASNEGCRQRRARAPRHRRLPRCKGPQRCSARCTSGVARSVTQSSLTTPK